MISVRRLHLFEFEDQPWLPHRWRDLLTELLAFQITRCAIYEPAVAPLQKALEASGCRRIIDLGSGAGGTALQMQKRLRQAGCPVSLTLTDKFPNRRILARIQGLGTPHITYRGDPVDAAQVPADLTGFRTLFTCFHHFDPDAARRVLAKAVEDRAPIGVFELTERTLANLLGMLPAPLAVLFQTPKVAPRSLERLVWTYLLPVIPFLYWWDGTVSHWRTYSVRELRGLAAGLGGDSYSWEAGRIGGHRAAVTYLIGLPQRRLPSGHGTSGSCTKSP